MSDESGRTEVYVREFPGGQRQQQVSVNGGSTPRWSPRGDEMFFVADNSLMGAAVQQSATALVTGIPRALFAAATIGAVTIDDDVAVSWARSGGS